MTTDIASSDQEIFVEEIMFTCHGFTSKPLKFNVNVVILAFCACRRKGHGRQPIGRQGSQQTWMLLSLIRYHNNIKNRSIARMRHIQKIKTFAR